MKLPYAVVAILLTSLLLLAGVNLADAQWNALDSGYAVTTNWHGKGVPVGEQVTAWAGTTDTTVHEVEFIWNDENDKQAFGQTFFVPVIGPYETPNVPIGVPEEIIEWASLRDGSGLPGHFAKVSILYASNTQIPNSLGEWGIQAYFHNTGNIQGQNSDIVMIKATSFNVVPEVPFGTIAILLGWFGVLGVFALRKKHNPS